MGTETQMDILKQISEFLRSHLHPAALVTQASIGEATTNDATRRGERSHGHAKDAAPNRILAGRERAVSTQPLQIHAEPPEKEEIWEVVGGDRCGGILVRKGYRADAEKEEERL